jgi:CubicO group peptidase (beta-lactamase class C family)
MRSSAIIISRSPKKFIICAKIREYAGIFLELLLLSLMSAGASTAAGLAGLQQIYDGAMLPDIEVAAFSHTEKLLPARIVHRGVTTQSLHRRAAAFPPIHFEDRGRRFDLYDYLATNRVAGLLVLKDGEIALEDYELGATESTRWASFSMAKSVASTLVGIALRDGLIASIDDPLVRYVPALRGSAYEGVSIRQLLTMSSGARWDETYTDPKSDRRQMLDLQINGKPGDLLKFMASLPRAAQPGTAWNYSTGETFVIGAVLEGAIHRPLAEYLSQKIWAPAGMESDATWWTDGPNGIAWAGSGLGATLRDYGRFGLFAANGGKINGRAIVPEGWFAAAGSPSNIGGKSVAYGYMWWIPPQSDPVHAGAFQAQGIFGQYIYINPRERLVIVVLSARSKPSRGSRFDLDDDAFFSAVATALH